MYEDALKQLSHKEWEFFAEDVLFHLGFDVLIGPSEGPDDGMDLVVQKDNIKYIVSCKHNIESGKSVGINGKSSTYEGDILDRVEQHNCKGFIPFYSTGPTSGLKKRLEKLKDGKIKIIEIYKTHILEIIPTMQSFVLQKYFQEVHNLTHHTNSDSSEYKPLICLKTGCGKDVIAKENIHLSMALLAPKEGELDLLFGCKNCINGVHEIGWAELTQIRHIEQLIGWRAFIDDRLNDEYKPSKNFYQCWALLQEAITQVLVPPGWGRWLG